METHTLNLGFDGKAIYSYNLMQERYQESEKYHGILLQSRLTNAASNKKSCQQTNGGRFNTRKKGRG